jgi:hypothetical protein
MTEWLRGISLVSTLLGYLDVIDAWLGKCRWVSGYLLGLRLAYEQLLLLHGADVSREGNGCLLSRLTGYNPN